MTYCNRNCVVESSTIWQLLTKSWIRIIFKLKVPFLRIDPTEIFTYEYKDICYKSSSKHSYDNKKLGATELHTNKYIMVYLYPGILCST